uniref:hypothetical protein n=1 Tax=Staphylococcus aureus TaxID=1280 RepID=UPI00203F3F3C
VFHLALFLAETTHKNRCGTNDFTDPFGKSLLLAGLGTWIMVAFGRLNNIGPAEPTACVGFRARKQERYEQ